MSATRKKNVTIRIDESVLEDFDRLLKKAQGSGDIPLEYTRSQLIREWVELATENPELMEQVAEG